MAAAAAAALEDLADDILLHIFRRLDGPSLASIGIASSHLHRLSSVPSLWLNLCITTYPSLLLLPSIPFSPHTFFSRAFPFPFPSSSAATKPFPDFTSSFIDLRHRGTPILSQIITTDTRSASFLLSPFRLDAIDRHLQPDPEFSAADLELSWVMADRTGERVVDLSSGKAVSFETNWFNGNVVVRFEMDVGEGRVVVAVMCSVVGVREVALMVEDGEGVVMNGRESMVVIGKLMEGERRKREKGGGCGL